MSAERKDWNNRSIHTYCFPPTHSASASAFLHTHIHNNTVFKITVLLTPPTSIRHPAQRDTIAFETKSPLN